MGGYRRVGSRGVEHAGNRSLRPSVISSIPTKASFHSISIISRYCQRLRGLSTGQPSPPHLALSRNSPSPPLSLSLLHSLSLSLSLPLALYLSLTHTHRLLCSACIWRNDIGPQMLFSLRMGLDLPQVIWHFFFQQSPLVRQYSK